MTPTTTIKTRAASKSAGGDCNYDGDHGGATCHGHGTTAVDVLLPRMCFFVHEIFTGAGIFFFSTGVQGGSSVAGVAALPASSDLDRREPGEHACQPVCVS